VHARISTIIMKRLIFVFLFTISLFTIVCTRYSKQTSAVKSDLLSYRNSAGIKRPVNTLAEWKLKKEQIIDSLQMAMGRLPDRSNLPALDIQITDSVKEEHYNRLTISFTVAENERVPAYLYIPIQKGAQKKLPAMLALHETDPIGKGSVDGQGKNLNLAYAKELAQRGYVVIAPDYPSFGDLKDYDFKKDRYQSGMMKSIFDDMRCVDLLQARKDVDPERIGVIGHSLGGHSAMFAGAFDTRLKVIVSSCGWTLFDYYNIGEEGSKKYGGQLGPWAQERYMPLLRDRYNLDAEKIPFDFDEIIAVLAPRAFFSNSPVNDGNFNVEGVRKGISNAVEVYNFLKAQNNLQVRYPVSEHNFPTEVRLEAYQFVDKVLQHHPE